MKPKRIILIRHGESEGNVSRTVYHEKPDYALELSEEGVIQAIKASVELRAIVENESIFFYISPFWRTRSTFEHIAKLFDREKIQWVEEPRIREQEWGHLRSPDEGLLIEKDRDAYGTFYFRIPDGESAADVYDRVSDFLGTLHRDFEKENYPDNTVIITHGMAIRLFLMRWFHWTVEDFEVIANPKNCQIVVMEKHENGHYELKTALATHNVKSKWQRPLRLE
ncbi:MAG: histidine phosphatase family protein [Bacteroidota bacterium]|jgi:broad specificity phosphatase PhoE|nr:histidine phosphatase family protein [Bacteroidota bacterium]